MKRLFFLYSTSIFVLSFLIIFHGCKDQDQSEQVKGGSMEKTSLLEAVELLDLQSAYSDLKILYVSNPDSARAKDFVDFLGKNFMNVNTADLKTFKETDSNGFDVTILDCDGDGFDAPRPRLSYNFSKPLLTVGVIGALICDTMNLKTGYL